MLVSLLCADENEELGLEDERAIAEALGMRFVSFPIADRGVPDSASDFLSLVSRLANELRNGRGVVAFTVGWASAGRLSWRRAFL